MPDARDELRDALRDPIGALEAKLRTRDRIDRRTQIDLPGDETLAASIRWSKQMLAASEQRVSDARLRGSYGPARSIRRPSGTAGRCAGSVPAGRTTPGCSAPTGSTPRTRRWPPVSSAPIKAHLRALRDVSEIVNEGSGKIVHEVTPDGAVYFGANADAGNTDESSKYPSAVNLVWKWTGDRAFLRDLYPGQPEGDAVHRPRLDADRDGWPEGLGQRRAARDG